MKTLDEFDVEWVVKSKDPAINLVRQLEKANFSLIILPRSCYLSGNVVEWKLPLYDPTEAHAVRLADCILALQ